MFHFLFQFYRSPLHFITPLRIVSDWFSNINIKTILKEMGTKTLNKTSPKFLEG